MTKENQNFDINAGDTVKIEDTVEDKDGSTRDLTDHTGEVTVASYRGGPVVLQFDDTDNRFSFTDRINGEIEVTLESSDTEEFAGSETTKNYYEIELEKDGTRYTVTTGTITAKPSY